MNLHTLHENVARADEDAQRAAETAARAHEDAPGSGIEADALDDLVAALRERDLWHSHLDVAQAEAERADAEAAEVNATEGLAG